jgi:opacity protein-like surface antigen
MKRFIIIAVLATMSFTAIAQPRSVGIRLGTTGSEASYQHSFGWNHFIEGEVGLDFGAGVKSPVGFKAAATYNIIWARPAWTDRGSWALYAGPGLAFGAVADNVSYKINNIKHIIADNGFMMSLAVQAGVEYTFWFPLQLSLDMRPYFGFHTNKGYEIVGGPASIQYGAKTSFYDRGLLGFIPTLSVRYRF